MHRFALSSLCAACLGVAACGDVVSLGENDSGTSEAGLSDRATLAPETSTPPPHQVIDAMTLLPPDGAPLSKDSSSDSSSEAPACYADMPFTPPPWKPPTPLHEGACTALELQRIAQCAGASDCTSGSATCDACAETDIGAAAYGPIITRLILGQRRFVEVNWGGCQANFDGDASAGGCGNQTNSWQSCLFEECPACTSVDACIEFAAEHGCSGSSETFACASEWSSDSGVPTCAYLQTLLTLWCGP